MQCQVVVEVDIEPDEGKLQEYHQYINDNEVLNNIGKSLVIPEPELRHSANVEKRGMKCCAPAGNGKLKKPATKGVSGLCFYRSKTFSTVQQLILPVSGDVFSIV